MSIQNQLSPFFSIVIPTYNRKEKLLKTIQSALSQSYKNFELIIVDDGSNDGTERAISEIEDVRIEYIRHKTCRGANAARNTGIHNAKGDYISFLDSDDRFLENKLFRIAEEIKNMPDQVIFLSSSIQVTKNEEAVHYHPSLCLKPKQFRNMLCNYLIDPSTSGLIIRRDILLGCGGFDESLKRMQDRELLLRLSGQYGCQVIEDILWKKNWSDDGVSSYTRGYLTAFMRILDKHEFFLKDYREACNYLIFRALAKQFRQGRFLNLFQDIRSLTLDNRFPTNLISLRRDYLSVRKIRRDYRAEKRMISLRSKDNKIVVNTKENSERNLVDLKTKFPTIF